MRKHKHSYFHKQDIYEDETVSFKLNFNEQEHGYFTYIYGSNKFRALRNLVRAKHSLLNSLYAQRN